MVAHSSPKSLALAPLLLLVSALAPNGNAASHQLQPQQAQTTAAPAAQTITATTHLVYVDVAVRDAAGQPVHGLTEKNFKLSEDGHPQSVTFFSTHRSDAPAAEQRPAQPPSGYQFTNVPQPSEPGAVNIILFDLLNTPTLDQVYARTQMIQFLKTLPPGRPSALFVLTDRLRLIQGFTGSSSELLAAAEKLAPGPSRLTASEADRQTNADLLNREAKAIGHTVPSNIAASRTSVYGGTMLALSRALSEEEVFTTEMRVRETFPALAELARAANGYPGRKNLFWLSGDFPTGVGGVLQSDDPLHSIRLQDLNIPGAEQTANLIASSQMAVYPINVLGMQTLGVGAETGGDAEVNLAGGLGATLNRQVTERAARQSAMLELAEQTGGEAFFNTNDLAGALRRGFEDGANYYTLAYSPRNHDWNSKFRRIRVEMVPKGYPLSYRRGYFAFPDEPPSGNSPQEIKSALQPEIPEMTMLRLQANVRSGDPGHPGIRIDSLIDPASVGFTGDATGRKLAKLIVTVVAYPEIATNSVALKSSAANKSATPSPAPPRTTGLLNIALEPDAYASILRSGIPVHQQLSLPPGHYRLRLGVSDTTNHRIGTLDMAVNVAAAVKGHP